MHIYFIGIGGTAIGPLALIAHQMGYSVSGSDKQNSQYIEYLKKQGVTNINVGTDEQNIAQAHAKSPIDWVVYTSAVPLENPEHPEINFAEHNNIKHSKRDELLSKILQDSGKKLIAIAGTHGKTTTTAMTIWLFKELGLPLSYSVGAKISFGEMGHYDEKSEYFVYECDEFDYNFLAYHPYLSIITGVDYDHHEIFKTRENYQKAFQQFIDQSETNIVWRSDLTKNSFELKESDLVLEDDDQILSTLSNPGEVNRRNAFQVITALSKITNVDPSRLKQIIESFPGLSRRFEMITNNLYTDYAHTIPKIEGCLQMAKEKSNNVVVIYEPLTNRRQHFIKDGYKDVFLGIKRLYWVPSYLAREDPEQTVLKPEDLIEGLSNKQIAEPAELNEDLKNKIKAHIDNGDLVVSMSGGGGHSLDEWLRKEFSDKHN